MADEIAPVEAPGSSAKTAVAVGAGAVLGAVALAPVVIAAAPILLPAAAAAYVIGSAGVVATAVGGGLGWLWGGKK